MTLRPGSFCWLLAHDLRLGWRGVAEMFGGADARSILIVALAIGGVLHGLAWPAALWLSPWVHGEAGSAPLVAIVTCAFTWLLAQSLFGSARTLYQRGDLDLLLGSPVSPRHVFAAKAVGIAAGSFGSIALLTLPIANMGALVDTPAWLGVYPALLALALIATALGLAMTIALFFWLGPARARLWTQMTGAVIAGAFVLAAQVAAVLPVAMREALSAWLEAPWRTDAASALALVRLPIDVVHGDARAAFILMFAVPRAGAFVSVGQELDAVFDVRPLDHHFGNECVV